MEFQANIVLKSNKVRRKMSYLTCWERKDRKGELSPELQPLRVQMLGKIHELSATRLTVKAITRKRKQRAKHICLGPATYRLSNTQFSFV